MKRAGTIYLRNNKENVVPEWTATRRKDSFDLKSNCTKVSLKDFSHVQLKSTSDYDDSLSLEERLNADTLRQELHSSINDKSISDSVFDSLAPYEKKLPNDMMLSKLSALQNIFVEVKKLRGLEKNRPLMK